MMGTRNVIKNSKNERKLTNSALPIYVSITEFGKRRLSEIFCFLEKYVAPENIRFLYSNVDNLVFALAAHCIDCAVISNLRKSYFDEKPNFFTPDLPGHVKQEFFLSSDQAWKFVSGMTQNYALIAKDSASNVHKNSALSKVSTAQAYKVSCAILNKKRVVVSQTRRVNKMLNREVKKQNFTFN
jgi:hypothetical protein